MSAHFINVMRQALKTFDRSNQSSFNANFTLLKQLTDQLTYSDMQLSQQKLLNEAAFDRSDHAPCTFMHIFENDIVSMSVFVMRSGYTMPLHDHPMMHGILRGIYGQLRVQSYTQKFGPQEALNYDRKLQEVRVVPEEPRLVSTGTESAVLTPYERNFHEITAINGLAAFFDILSPPYDANMPVYGMRRCRFYHPQIINDIVKTTFPKSTVKDERNIEPVSEMLQLVRIPAPLSYYCDTAEAPEAVAKCTFICSAEAYSST